MCVLTVSQPGDFFGLSTVGPFPHVPIPLLFRPVALIGLVGQRLSCSSSVNGEAAYMDWTVTGHCPGLGCWSDALTKSAHQGDKIDKRDNGDYSGSMSN